MQRQDKALKRFLEDIKQDLLFYIISSLREKKINLGQAKALAKDYLTLFPVTDKEDVLNKLYTIAGVHAGAREVYVKYAAPYEEEKRLKLLQNMRVYMQKNDYDTAVAVAKGVLS